MSETSLKRLVDIHELNQPCPEDADAFSGGSEDVVAGTAVTITFTVLDGWTLFLKEVYMDARDDCNYVITACQHPAFDLNNVTFERPATGTGTCVQITISNAGVADKTVGYFIRGWLRRSKGEQG